MVALTGCGASDDPYSSLNCGQLRDIAENRVMHLDPDATDEELLQAIEGENAARERMDELSCFEN